ncbi:MAG: glycosyltransferase [Nodosilinea sp.]
MSQVLLLSMREASNLVAYSHLYEFEDVVADVLDADIVKLTHHDELDGYRKVYKATKTATGSRRIASCVTHQSINKSLKQPLDQDYDLLISPFNTPYELFMLLSLGNWRSKAKKAVCYIIEFWQHDIPKCNHLLDHLQDFDHIFLGTRQCVDTIAEITGKPCSYLPLSVDALRFCPEPSAPQPILSYCNLGRRSLETHQGLMSLAENTNSFYYYDTIGTPNVTNASKQITFHVKNFREHRFLLANILRRSRYFIANRARANERKLEKGKDELSSRFFEGAAAGTVMLGEPPDSQDFRDGFDWVDAVIEIPFDCPDIAKIVSDLENQPERLARIRQANITNSLLRHDSVYRLKTILRQAGYESTAKIHSREAHLKQLAQTHLESQPPVEVALT